MWSRVCVECSAVMRVLWVINKSVLGFIFSKSGVEMVKMSREPLLGLCDLQDALCLVSGGGSSRDPVSLASGSSGSSRPTCMCVSGSRGSRLAWDWGEGGLPLWAEWGPHFAFQWVFINPPAHTQKCLSELQRHN